MSKRIKQLKKMLRLEINLPVYLIIFLLVIIIVAYIYIINLNIDLSSKVESLGLSDQQLEDDLLEIDRLRIVNDELNKKAVNLTNKVKTLEEELTKTKSELTALESFDDLIRAKIKACAESYGIDPYLAIAISRHETGNWTSELCLEGNNFGGMRGSNNWYTYDSIDSGIDAFCKMLKDYKNNGMGTINTMANTYCGDNSSHWINSVEYFYEQEKDNN